MTTKEKILLILSKKQNISISGEVLAKQCNVSRAAIWKAVNSLRGEGYLIVGTTNGGYIFSENNDVFSKEIFQKEFETNFPKFKNSYLECYKEIDSTNSYAKRLLAQVGNLRDQNSNLTLAGKKYHNAIIVAESQSAGRGRLGRTFYSPAKTGIYLSIICSPKNGISKPAKLTAFSAVAVCRAIKKLYNIDASIKWINDIFINNKKVAGILTEGIMNFETSQIESAIIGIGINIQNNSEAFPEEVKKIVGAITSSDECSKNKISRCQLAAEVAGQVLSILNEDSHSVISEYKSLSFLLGKKIQVHPIIDNTKNAYEAKAIDLDENAGLIVELADGSKKILNCGEVSILSSNI